MNSEYQDIPYHCDTEIKHKFLNEDKLIFYQELKDYKFPKINSLCLRIAAICVSTYLCEHFFSNKLNLTKTNGARTK